MIPLICIDVDGTLVGRSGQVRRPVLAAVDRATAQGQHLALTTARGAFGASWSIANRIDESGWHVFHAGASVVHAGTGEVHSDAFTTADVEATAAIGADNGWVVEFYAATDYTVDNDDDLAVSHAALLGVPFRRRQPADLNGEVVRMQYVVPTSLVGEVERATSGLGLVVTGATSPIMPGTTFVSFTRPGVSKATGISVVAGYLGVEMADVMMIGDGVNDLPALAAVGHPVAMGNSEPEVLEVADHVVADVDNDGVVEALELSLTLS